MFNKKESSNLHKFYQQIFKSEDLFLWVIIIFVILINSCSNRNTPFGFPETNMKNYEIEFDFNIFDFENTYTYRDTLRAFFGNSKLILGNYQNINTRILMRFVNLPAVNLVEDPFITLYINNRHNPSEFNIKIGALKDKIFLQNDATWTKFNETEEWTSPGAEGDYDLLSEISYNFAENDTLLSFRFSVNKELVQDWIDKSFLENYGIIFYAENTQDSFIEFHSAETLLRPTITLTYMVQDTLLQTETRQVNYDTFIHDYEHTSFGHKLLEISNIPPRSIYTKLNLDFETNKEYYVLNGIFSAEELKRINVIQSYLIFSVNEDETMRTIDRFNLGVAVPHETPIDMNDISLSNYWLYPATVDSLRQGNFNNKEMRINITYPMQQILSENRPNNGFLILNNYHNMDFSHINLYSEEAIDERKRPRMVLIYAVVNYNGD
ncbi:MAG: hypothetical protein FWG98_08080 [Candidatus Cloacimonetes bacterium]|nr:hypothetical protein [Candidatus Cloacimonadota bacterium]